MGDEASARLHMTSHPCMHVCTPLDRELPRVTGYIKSSPHRSLSNNGTASTGAGAVLAPDCGPPPIVAPGTWVRRRHPIQLQLPPQLPYACNATCRGWDSSNDRSRTLSSDGTPSAGTGAVRTRECKQRQLRRCFASASLCPLCKGPIVPSPSIPAYLPSHPEPAEGFAFGLAPAYSVRHPSAETRSQVRLGLASPLVACGGPRSHVALRPQHIIKSRGGQEYHVPRWAVSCPGAPGVGGLGHAEYPVFFYLQILYSCSTR
jgi:hypothetical protein